MISTLDFMWRGGNVVRYHTHPTLRPDYVGHHSYNGACMVMVLRPGRDDLAVEFLKHDMSEWKFGDMPAPAKRAMPAYDSHFGVEGEPPTSFREVFGQLEEEAMVDAGIVVRSLAPADAWLLKLVDALDGMRYCVQERRMGNAGIAECYHNFNDYVCELMFGKRMSGIAQLHAIPLECAQPQDLELYKFLQGEWHDLCK